MNKYIVAALSRLRVLHYCNCELFCAVVLTHIFAFNQMDRVISTIKSLECVNVLQVNVKEDKEVVVPCFGHGSGSGSGSGYVNKHEEIDEMDASNAEDPTQDNSTESDEEDNEPFVLR